MTDRERDAITALCLMAAFADGQKADAEREKLREILAGLGGDASAAMFQRVLLKQTSLEAEAAALGSPELRMLAYEMAVSMCEADGRTTGAEQAFLGELRRALAMPEAEATRIERQVVDVAASPPEALPAWGAAGPASAAAEGPATAAGARTTTAERPVPATAAAGAPAADPRDAEIDQSVLRYAILNGGLELLPQGLATMAIIPLQLKMVYEIGQRFGFKLDRGHAQELVAAAGLGMTSQVFEGYARKFLGKMVKQVAGKGIGGLASATAGAAVTFASTYALGMVAKTYYAGGRRLDAAAIRAEFQRQLERGNLLFNQYRPQVEQSAKTVDLSQLLSTVRR
jgi:uncharacterized protein (DUF697 family)